MKHENRPPALIKIIKSYIDLIKLLLYYANIVLLIASSLTRALDMAGQT
mgnify:CR=1 FL=1